MEPLNAQTLRLHHLDVLAFFFSFYTFNRLLNPTNSSLNVSYPFFPTTMKVIILLTTGTYLGAMGSILFPFCSQGLGGSEHGRIAVKADFTC